MLLFGLLDKSLIAIAGLAAAIVGGAAWWAANGEDIRPGRRYPAPTPPRKDTP